VLPDYLEGAIDLHVHSSPDVDPRRSDDIDLAREAARAGMSGLLIKSHQNSTVERAWLVSKVVPGIAVFGGLVLNEPVGGLNPAAVRVALKLGARQIWMPTRSARNHREHHGQPGGISVLDDAGQLLAAAREIVDLLIGSPCVLGTGHLSPEESITLIAYARSKGVRVIVTHPEWSGTFFTVGQQRTLAAAGGVYFERCFVSTTHRCGFTPWDTITDAIAAIGPETTVAATDLGQPDTPAPVEGLRMYADKLLAAGFSREQVRSMMVDNPAAAISMIAHDRAQAKTRT
jgi:hypothetical protein